MYNLNNISEKMSFLKFIVKIILNLESEIEKEIYIEEFSKRYDITKEALIEEVYNIKK